MDGSINNRKEIEDTIREMRMNTLIRFGLTMLIIILVCFEFEVFADNEYEYTYYSYLLRLVTLTLTIPVAFMNHRFYLLKYNYFKFKENRNIEYKFRHSGLLLNYILT